LDLTHRIDRAARRATVTGSGRLTMPAMLEAVERVAADPDHDPCHMVIFDIRSGDYTAELSDGDDFVAALKRLETDFQGRFALVVPESLKVLAGLFCLLANVAGIDRIRSFTGIEQAVAWCSEPADVAAGPGGSAARERSV